jgi:hypothetical protein
LTSAADLLFPIAIPAVLLDLTLLGVLPHLFGVGSWFKGYADGERVVYQRFLSAVRGMKRCPSVGSPWRFHWSGRTTITNRRLLSRAGWRGLAVLDIPVGAVREVGPGRVWWYRTVYVRYRTTDGDDDAVHLFGWGMRRIRQDMFAAFESVGVRVERA